MTNNTPLWRLAIRRLRQRPLQYLLLILGVAIGVAMMISIDLANGSARRAFQLSTDAITGRTTHRIVAGQNGLDEAVYLQLRRELGYQLAAPVVDGYVDADTLGPQPFQLLGIDPFAEGPFRNFLDNPTSGEGFDGLTTFLVEPNAVIVSADLATQAGLGLGDELLLDVNGRSIPTTITGLLDSDDSSNTLDNIIFTDIASAQEILNRVGRLSHIDLIVDDDATLATIEAILPTQARIETAASQQNAIQQMTAAFTLNLTALSLLALIVGMFLIYNTVTFSVVQRRPLFGVLRCLGVTQSQLFTLIVAEATILGFVGALLGVGLGVILGQGTVRLITQTINDLYFVVNVQGVAIDPGILLRGLIIGTIAAVLAAIIPAWEAMRTPPQTTLRRSSQENRIRQILPWLLLVWAVLTAVGIGLLAVRGGGVATAFGGLFSIVIGAALLTPPITAVSMRILTPIGQRLLGILGQMAPRDIGRSLSRTSVAIAALMTAVSVIVGVSIMIGSFRNTVVQWLGQTLQADIYISPPGVSANRPAGSIDPDIIAAVNEWPGVTLVSAARPVSAFVPSLDREVGLVAADIDVSQGNRPYAWQKEGITPWDALTSGGVIIISEALVLKENLTIPPEPIVLETAVGPREFEVAAVIYDYASDQGTIFINRNTYAELWQDDAISSLAAFVSEDADVDAIVTAMQTTFAPQQDLLIRSNQSLRQTSLEVFDRTFAITSALRMLAVIVAFIGVLSALMSLQLEQSQELGILRATGMTIRQLWSLTLLKTGLIGAMAGIFALPVGFVMAWILIYVINVRSFGWTLQMQLQPSYFLQSLAVAILAALLAGIYPAWRLGNMVIATAIRQE
ncbi:MAG: FtsX-like permease family protein [Chloroflexota bacterium]